MKKVVVIGAESSGKTTLCEDLSKHFAIPYIPEFSRTYMEENGSDYTLEDVEKMAQGQLDLEDVFEQDLQIIDTNLYVYKIWIEEKYNTTIDWIEQEIVNRHYDHYLLCDFDIPYQEDEFREHPNKEDRQRLFNRYKELLEHDGCSFTTVSGSREERLEKSARVIDEIASGKL